jgi:hypothetical protein
MNSASVMRIQLMPTDLSKKPGGNSRNPKDPESGQAENHVKKTGSGRPDSGAGRRRIEALRERQALREALGDIFDDDPEIDDEIFDVNHDNDQYFIKPAKQSGKDESFDELSVPGDIDDDIDDEIDDEIEEEIDD